MDTLQNLDRRASCYWYKKQDGLQVTEIWRDGVIEVWKAGHAQHLSSRAWHEETREERREIEIANVVSTIE